MLVLKWKFLKTYTSRNLLYRNTTIKCWMSMKEEEIYIFIKLTNHVSNNVQEWKCDPTKYEVSYPQILEIFLVSK